ncbi:sodium- and chloride-dependent glycine transporter 1-like [Brachionus plicatilis]|uniref:Transporter n=1 Tax=Brachionus plicatilis TaxID=10195 RepID=A0A3M7QTP7_BRAPC|nr:sodium- and chloride-dependent glycine transporter 1-like [Brachionus plicatilis]
MVENKKYKLLSENSKIRLSESSSIASWEKHYGTDYDFTQLDDCYENSELAKKNNENDNKINKRETWVGKNDFFLSALAYAVGLGAVWRFPYLCYKNGGGVFLIPYLIFLVTIGFPLVFLELCVGQFTSNGPLTCWRMTPFFRGIGLSMNIANTYLCIYYNVILAYAIYFLYHTLKNITGNLPWENCKVEWSSPNCLDEHNTFNISLINCTNDFLKCKNGICYEKFNFLNETLNCSSKELVIAGIWKSAFPSQDFWDKIILEKTASIDETGHLVWQLVVALFLSWVLVFLMVLNGIKVSGKLVYFTALFPYFVLIILGIRGLTLPGAYEGIKYYIYPDLSRLTDYTVWTDAAVQLFFTLSVAYGGLITLSSYNTFHTNIMRDAIFVTVSNCITSIFAGFVVFAFIGYLSFKTGREINDVIQAGQGLAYVVYPFAVTTIKGSVFWAFLFFFMMLVLGLDTMMTSVESLITSILDGFPCLKINDKRRKITVALTCLALFLGGLIFCFQSGTYWIELFDAFSGSWAILLVACLECISISWFYGFDNIKNDISAMLGCQLTRKKYFLFWKIMWTIVSPLVLTIVCVLSWIDFKGLKLNEYVFPHWSNVFGISLSISTLSGVIIWSIFSVAHTVFIQKKPFKSLFVPGIGWKPLKEEHCILVNELHKRDFSENFDKGIIKKFFKQFI